MPLLNLKKQAPVMNLELTNSHTRQYKRDRPNERIIDIEFVSQNNANTHHFVTVPNIDNIEGFILISQ